MRTRLLLLALLFAGLAACSDPPAASPVTAQAPTAPVVASGTLRVADQAGSAGPVRLAELARLDLDATYQGEPGVHVVRFDVTGPTGITFTQLRGSLEASADGRGAARRTLEVRGTPIDAYHMTGAWKFTLVVDDTPLASATIEVTD
jgi:hypothetical protein